MKKMMPALLCLLLLCLALPLCAAAAERQRANCRVPGHYRDDGMNHNRPQSCWAEGHLLCDGMDHGWAPCGYRSHFNCDGKTHEPAPCGAEKHWICRGGEHETPACGIAGHCISDEKSHRAARCGVEGHYACDGQSHQAAACGKEGHTRCDGLDHAKAACGRAKHYVCDGQEHSREICSGTKKQDAPKAVKEKTEKKTQKKTENKAEQETAAQVFVPADNTDGYRISSAGKLSELAGSCVTDYIPCTAEDAIYLKGAAWTSWGDGASNIVFYDKNKKVLGSYNSDGKVSGKILKARNAEVVTDADGVTVMNFAYERKTNLAYVRVSAMGSAENMAVTAGSRAGVGMVEGYRLSSTGRLSELEGSVVTGYIACTPEDTIYLSGAEFATRKDECSYITFYDEELNLLGSYNSDKKTTGKVIRSRNAEILTDVNGMMQMKLNYHKDASFAYIRVSAMGTADEIDVTTNGQTAMGNVDGYRLSSTGSLQALEGSAVTGYIPCTPADVIYMKGADFVTWEKNRSYVAFYDAEFNYLGSYNSDGKASGGQARSRQAQMLTDANGLMMLGIPYKDEASFAYVRVSAKGSAEELAVMVNEHTAMGALDGYRLSSTGKLVELRKSVATGYIPCTPEDTICIKGAQWTSWGGSSSYVTFYDENLNLLGSYNAEGKAGGKVVKARNATVLQDMSGMTMLSFKCEEGASYAYIRVSAMGSAEETTVTLNNFAEMGVMDGYRLSSTGKLVALEGSAVTGYIPCTPEDAVCLTGAQWTAQDGGNSYVAFYDKDLNFLGTYNAEGKAGGGVVKSRNVTVLQDMNGMTMLRFSSEEGASYAYVRVSAMGNPDEITVKLNAEAEMGTVDGYRLSSTGSLVALEGSAVTGYIACTPADTICLSGAQWATWGEGRSYIAFYDADLNLLGSYNSDGKASGDQARSKDAELATDTNGVTAIGVPYKEGAAFAYIRVSAKGSGADMAVTLNRSAAE